jgi:universal stress protein E
MNAIRSILAIVDPTAKEQVAVRKAALLAVALGAHLELLACDTRATAELRRARRLGSPKGAPASLEEWLQGLARTVQPTLEARNLDLSTALICGDPLHEQLLQWIGKSPADLIVKDTHHHALAQRTFIGNTDWHLIRSCRVPLLLTKAIAWSERPRLAAALDPREEDEDAPIEHRILECALLLAAALEGDVRIVHSYVPAMLPATVGGAAAAVAPSPEVLAAEQAMQRGRIQMLLDRFGLGGLEQHVELGAAVEYLPRFAEENSIDLFVMGAQSRSHLKQAVIGSTAERVLERLPCDVLLIKPLDPGESLPF